MNPAPDRASIQRTLDAIGQQHVLAFFDTLDTAAQRGLLDQLASVNLDSIPALVSGYVKSKPKHDAAAAPEPVPFFGLGGSATSGGSAWDVAQATKHGEDLIAAGKVAAFTVAGGQGTRLGFDGPKGCYPGGAVTGKPLFACLAEWILATQRKYAKGPASLTIPWYIMTSPLNHAATVAFFEKNAYFGLAKSNVMFFPQGMMPAFDMATGKMLLSAPGELALSPDGHGGSLAALVRSGAIADMKRRGVEILSYTQIDNPLVRVIDPAFIGLHAQGAGSSGQMSSKMIPKAAPDEKVGVFCRLGGKTAMMEYSDLPAELARKVDGAGKAVFNAGNPAIHILSVSFIEQLATAGSGVAMPLHRAEKKVPFVDLATGKQAEPTSPNAIKLELFIFDALALCQGSIVLETDRAEEFAPIKNATGTDSAESSRAMQTARAARWIEQAGGSVPRRPDGTPDCVLELSPLTALWPAELRGKALPVIAAGSRVPF